MIEMVRGWLIFGGGFGGGRGEGSRKWEFNNYAFKYLFVYQDMSLFDR